MSFSFISEVGELTEVQMLVNIYNLLLMCLYVFLLYIGYRTIIRVIRKGSAYFKWLS